MGNCCVIKRSKSEEEEEDLEDYNKEDHEITASSSSAVAASTDQVKIKISKKQLQGLLSKVDQVQGLSVEQVLLQLMKLNKGDKYQQQEQPWRPSLKSIPEVN